MLSKVLSARTSGYSLRMEETTARVNGEAMLSWEQAVNVRLRDGANALRARSVRSIRCGHVVGSSYCKELAQASKAFRSDQ